jgi:hypothetical protein
MGRALIESVVTVQRMARCQESKNNPDGLMRIQKRIQPRASKGRRRLRIQKQL